MDCIEHLLSVSYMIRAIDAKVDPYVLLTLADYYQSKKQNLTKVTQLYLDLFRNGDPQVTSADLTSEKRARGCCFFQYI